MPKQVQLIKNALCPQELKIHRKIILNTSEKISLNSSAKETESVVYDARNIHDNNN